MGMSDDSNEKKTGKKLYDYQHDAIEKIFEKFNSFPENLSSNGNCVGELIVLDSVSIHWQLFSSNELQSGSVVQVEIIPWNDHGVNQIIPIRVRRMQFSVEVEESTLRNSTISSCGKVLPRKQE